MDKPTFEQKQIPHNLPVRIQPFVDREKEIHEATQALLDPDIPIVTMTGIGGIGKTALALEMAYRLLEQAQFAGGICWLNCQGSDNTLDAILHTIQATFGLAPAPTLYEGVRRYLRTNPCLLVLDGYEAVAQEMEILAFLERLPEPSKALLTSREDIRLRQGWRLALAGLSIQDAVRLFVETADRYGLKVSPEQTSLVAEICQPLDGHPWAIHLAAAQAGSMSLPLDTLRQRITEGWKAPELEVVFEASYKRLSEQAKVLMRRLAMFVVDMNDEAIENVCQVEGWQTAWSELAAFGLLKEQAGRYSLHPVVKVFALELLEKAGEREKYEERAAAYFLAMAQFGESKLNTDEANMGIAIAENERANMLAGQEWYWANERWDEVIAYGYALGQLLDVAGFWADRLQALQRAVEASQRKGDAGEQARLLHNLAVVYQEQGDYAAARRFYQESLEINYQLEDKAGVSTSLYNLGALAQAQGNYTEARRLYQEAAETFEQLGTQRERATVLHQLGVLARDQGNYPEALRLYRQSLEIAEQLGDRAGIAQTFHQLAILQQAQGHYPEALRLYRQSLEIEEELGDRAGIASTLHQLGTLAQTSGAYEEALHYYEEASAISERLGDIRSLAITFGNLGTIFEDQGDFRQALGYLDKSAELLQRLGDASNLAIAYRAIARIRQKLGELEASIAALSQALILSLRVAPRPVLVTARQVVEFGKELIAQDRTADALTMVSRLGDVLDSIKREASAREVAVLPEEHLVIKEPALTYQTFIPYNPETLQAAALLKDALSVIASVALVRMEGSPPAQYDRALQALELARQVDKTTAGTLELAKWVREASGYEFVELEEADRWPLRLAYLVHSAGRYERDESWAAAIDVYRQARALLDPNKGEEELRRYTELGFRLGLCLKQDGRWSEALEQQGENVVGYKKLGNPYGKASAYLEMGHIYQMMNIYDLALLYYGEAYYLYQQAAEEARNEAAHQLAQRGMADAKEALGDLEFQLKVLPQALADLEEAAKLYITLDMPGKAAIIRQTLERAQVPAGGVYG